jgi:MoxR-like ATPase
LGITNKILIFATCFKIGDFRTLVKPKNKFMQAAVDIEALNQQIYVDSAFIEDLNAEASKVIVGQHYMLERLLVGLLAKGHVLLEGLPGLAKTLSIKTLASAINAQFNRIQFTPDLLPADIIGTMIYNPSKNDFSVRKGPIFANFILADEINRAPAKVQSALLEAMQERQVTIGKETFILEEPFLVLATQNPIEQEGTYPLPEAQTDRFMLKVNIGYPTKVEEKQIIRKNILGEITQKINPIIDPKTILKARESVRKIYMDEKIENYILDIVFASRNPEEYGMADLTSLISYGGSPRASINLAMAAKAYAFINRRGYVIPDDVRNICKDVMRHRIGITYEAEAENISAEDIIIKILNNVEVP